jgi:protease IV
MLRLCFIFIFILRVFSYADTPDTLRSYLNQGYGIRAMSMGNAFTAIGEGEGALYYNPAGLAIRGSSYSFQSLDLNNTFHENFTLHSYYVAPFAYSNVSLKDISGDHYNANVIGYGRRGLNGLDWGMSFKSIQAGIDDERFSAWTSDLGLKARVLPFMTVGLIAKNIMSDQLTIPLTYQGGIGVYNATRTFYLTADVQSHKYESDFHVSNHYGMEYVLIEGLTLRGGWSDHDFTAGLAMKFPAFDLEYGVQAQQYNVGVRIGQGPETDTLKKRYALFKPHAYAAFSLGSQIVQGKSEVSLFGGQKIGSNDLLGLIHEAGKDTSCKGFIIRVGDLGSSLSSIALVEEIRHELLKAQKNGKKIIVYLDDWAGLSEYYLASVADKIIMPELGSMSHLGVEIEVKKTKTFLENWGISSIIVSSGTYKSTLNSRSPTVSVTQRAYLEDIVMGLFEEVVSEIKASRSLDWAVVGPYFDGRVFSARQALHVGLIDHLAYFKDMDEYIETVEEDESIDTYSLSEYSPPFVQKPLIVFKRVAVIEIDGTISSGGNSSGFLFGGKSTGADYIDTVVERLNKDTSIKGVIVRVNSPGGSVVASDRIYRAIKSLRDKKKLVYVSMGNMAASGGYYVSLGADKIYANVGTLTGSVGVISSQTNFSGLNKKLDIDVDSITSGEHMGMMSSQTEMTDTQLSMLQSHQDMYYQLFVSLLMENRGLTRDEAYDIAQGHIVTGRQALDMKMVDALADFYDVVDDMAKALDLEDPDLVFTRGKSGFSLPLGRIKALAEFLAF